MTMQAQDTIIHRNNKYNIVALEHPFTFTPKKKYGIETKWIATACYRGFFCVYEIKEDVFMIKDLDIWAQLLPSYPAINGVEPKRVGKYIKGIRYEDLYDCIDYSGRILLGIATKTSASIEPQYSQVLELIVEDGIVLDETDVTELWKNYSVDNNSQLEYWWMDKNKSYFMLINFDLMGIH